MTIAAELGCYQPASITSYLLTIYVEGAEEGFRVYTDRRRKSRRTSFQLKQKQQREERGLATSTSFQVAHIVSLFLGCNHGPNHQVTLHDISVTWNVSTLKTCIRKDCSNINMTLSIYHQLQKLRQRCSGYRAEGQKSTKPRRG